MFGESVARPVGVVPTVSSGKALINELPVCSSRCENLKIYQQMKPDPEAPPEGFRPMMSRDIGVLKLGCTELPGDLKRWRTPATCSAGLYRA
jgi:hypothetical protein